MRKLLLLLTLFCCTAIATNASAQLIQQRFLPANGVRGTLGEPQQFPLIQFEKKVLRLTPGARIYDRSNRTIVHGQLPSNVQVLIATEPTSGYVNRLYILTEQEIERLKQAKR